MIEEKPKKKGKKGEKAEVKDENEEKPKKKGKKKAAAAVKQPKKANEWLGIVDELFQVQKHRHSGTAALVTAALATVAQQH